MSKRRYKCVEFKQVDWREIQERMVGERVVVAMDVAKEDFVATVLTTAEAAGVTFGWRHPQETAQVVERLIALGKGRRIEGVPCLGTERERLQWLASDLLAARREVQRIERALGRQVAREPVRVRMAAVIGTVSAAVLVAAVGSPQNDPNARSSLKALGLNLKERSSGKHKGQLKLTQRGPSLARFYLYFAALRLIAHDPVVKRWYQFKTSRPGAVKNKIVITLMRKLAQAVWQIAHGSPFEVNRRFDPEIVADA